MKHALLALCLLSACSPPSFDPSSLVRSVRILATRADQPYAAPGTSVTLEALSVDGREKAEEPMQLAWLAAPCFNPPDDAYYNCFESFRKGLGAGPVSPERLELGQKFQFEMPEDVIDTHAATGQTPYGLAVLYTIACAGQLVYQPPRAGGSPDAVPFVCLDRAGQRLGVDDFVFAYSLVYAFKERRNANPVFSNVTIDGTPVDLELGISLDHCNKPNIDDCPTTQLELNVASESQELDPSNLDASGTPQKEFLYAQYYATAGKFVDDSLILFDAHEGRLAHTGNDFRAPQRPGEYSLWVVLRDNRGGAAWQEIALHVH